MSKFQLFKLKICQNFGFYVKFWLLKVKFWLFFSFVIFCKNFDFLSSNFGCWSKICQNFWFLRQILIVEGQILIFCQFILIFFFKISTFQAQILVVAVQTLSNFWVFMSNFRLFKLKFWLLKSKVCQNFGFLRQILIVEGQIFVYCHFFVNVVSFCQKFDFLSSNFGCWSKICQNFGFLCQILIFCQFVCQFC